ncbi:MAG: response regulator [Dehalococcoidia bacterium]
MVKKVLLADDEERILGLVQATLGTDDRYDILTAADGEEALETCRREHPDLVFLDLLMPKMDGYAVCRELKQDRTTSDIKVVMLTAMVQEADRRTALKIGADDYMTKPFSPTALMAKVEEMLEL